VQGVLEIVAMSIQLLKGKHPVTDYEKLPIKNIQIFT
jgi:hypothetical protein